MEPFCIHSLWLDNQSQGVCMCSTLRLKDRMKFKTQKPLRAAASPKYLPDPIRAQISTMELYFISGALLSSESSLCRICTSWAFSRSFSAVPETQVKDCKSEVLLALLLSVSCLLKQVSHCSGSDAVVHKTEAYIRWYENRNHSSCYKNLE